MFYLLYLLKGKCPEVINKNTGALNLQDLENGGVNCRAGKCLLSLF